jgi:hypothetical protein
MLRLGGLTIKPLVRRKGGEEACGLNTNISGWGPVAVYCEHVNSIKGE